MSESALPDQDRLIAVSLNLIERMLGFLEGSVMLNNSGGSINNTRVTV